MRYFTFWVLFLSLGRIMFGTSEDYAIWFENVLEDYPAKNFNYYLEEVTKNKPILMEIVSHSDDRDNEKWILLAMMSECRTLTPVTAYFGTIGWYYRFLKRGCYFCDIWEDLELFCQQRLSEKYILTIKRNGLTLLDILWELCKQYNGEDVETIGMVFEKKRERSEDLYTVLPTLANSPEYPMMSDGDTCFFGFSTIRTLEPPMKIRRLEIQK